MGGEESRDGPAATSFMALRASLSAGASAVEVSVRENVEVQLRRDDGGGKRPTRRWEGRARY